MREGDDGLNQLHIDDLSMNSGKLLREQLTENFKAIEQCFNDFQKQIDMLNDRITNVEDEIKKLESSDVNTEYITDTDVATDYTTDAPTSVDIDDTNGDDEVQGLTIQEGGK